MENLFINHKTSPASAAKSTDDAATEKIRAAWRPKSGPAASLPSAAEQLDFSTRPATQQSMVDVQHRQTSLGIEQIDFSGVPKKDLDQMKKVVKLRLDGKHAGKIGYGLGPQIERLMNSTAGGHGTGREKSTDLDLTDRTNWFPVSGSARKFFP